LAALQLACAIAGPREWNLDDSSSLELYRRPTPPKPRIPGEVSSERRYASSEAPMRLTASDGTGLLLRRLQVRGLIDDPLSLTELQLTFENPHDRVLDGQFELLLPHGAELSRFAMKVGGEWIESEVVEREQARQVYQAHKHMQRDPALLERERGRRFSGRVFPIAPRERKQIRVSYTVIHEQIGGVFRVPLAGLPRVDEFDLQVVRRHPGADDEVLEQHGEHEALREDFTVALDGPDTVGVAAGTQALLRLVPVPTRALAEYQQPNSLSVLVDTSASMAGAAQASEVALAGLLAALEQGGLGQLPLEVLAFDQSRELLYRGPIAGADKAVIEALRKRTRLGASDLVAALDAVDPSAERVILFGDGELTAGGDTRYELAAALERAGARGLVRIDAVALGRSSDLELLEWMVASERLQAGVVFEADRSEPHTWVDDLLAPPLGKVSVEVVGAKQVWPASFEGLRPGQSVLVHASFARDAPTQAKLTLTGAASSSAVVELRRGDDPLIARSIAVLRVKALIAELEAGSGEAAVKTELVELSKQHGISSDYTAMLVLESERAYAEFGIERGATDRLTVSMEEANAMPVGSNTSRDFTAVIDMAPTASRDSAGISLAGTTGAESRYTLDDRRRRWSSKRWTARARGQRVGPRIEGLPKSARTLEHELDEAMQGCTQHAAALAWDDSYSDRYFDFTLALGLDAAGQLVAVRSGSYAIESSELFDCTRYQLRELAGDGFDQRPAKTEPAFELLRRYRLEYTRGPGSAPDDWRLPEVIEYARELAFAGQSGAAGWAKFIEEDIEAGLVEEALDVAWTWHQARPGELLPYVSLGRALTAAGQHEDAARAYGSLIDLHPARAETRRFAGALLESIDVPAALALAIDSYRKARALRPDHPSGYQALALALARRGDYEEAVDTLVDALGRTYADGRFGDVVELMRRDLATLAAAAILARPESRNQILTQLVDAMIVPEAVARDWLTLSWESDASHLSLQVSDIEDTLYIYDGVAPISQDVINGFGPQGFEWAEAIPGPIAAWVSVSDLGPEGVAMGCVRRVRFDGEGQLEFETRPFVIWPGQYRVALGDFGYE
jgi:tetratricopeptide (TPR) repeat protein